MKFLPFLGVRSCNLAFCWGNVKLQDPESFEKFDFVLSPVIPEKAGIKYFQTITGFRIKSGMTKKGVFQRSPSFDYNP
jgi:hypothetical protein